MNQNYLEQLIRLKPETTAEKYLFLVDRPELAMQIIISGFQAVCIHRDEFTVDGLMDLMEKYQFKGTYLTNRVYVTCLSTKKDNQIFLEYARKEFYQVEEGYWLFYKKEYLEKSEYAKELKDVLQEFIDRHEGTRQGERSLDYFHKINDKGKAIAPFDIHIVEYIMETVPFFIMNETAYVYENGVYRADTDTTILKAKIQECLYPEFIKSSILSSVYQLLISQKGLSVQFYEINNQPNNWINFVNGWLDVSEWKLHSHSSEYRSINQIPHSFETKWLEEEPDGSKMMEYMNRSIPNPGDREMFWEYLGYAMTTDTNFQRFLMIEGCGGTGKSVLVSIFQKVIGLGNAASISIQDLNKRFYATGLFGKLLNACADIPSSAMQDVDIVKKAVGEDTLLYEKKGADATQFTSYAKLLFSANELPLNLDEKSNAYYRRLMILEMNQMIDASSKDKGLKEKLYLELPYILTQAVKALRRAYEQDYLYESEKSKELVNALYRSADSIKAFLDENIMKVSGGQIRRSLMFQSYQDYCQENERTEHKKSNFFRLMEDKGYTAKRNSEGYYYDGVAFADKEFQPVEEDSDNPFMTKL